MSFSHKKNRTNRYLTGVLFFSVCVFSIGSVYPLQAQASSNQLLGKWRAETDFGNFDLIFHTSNRLEFDGESAGYSLLPGILRVQSEEGTIDYAYQLQGNTLVIAFPEGFQLQFKRVGDPLLSAQPKQESQNQIRTGGKKSTSSAPAVSPSQKTATSSIGPGEVGDPNWGFKFTPPAGWKFQRGYKGAVLGHDKIAGIILVTPHLLPSLDKIREEMQQELEDEGTMLIPSGPIQSAGTNGFSGDYSGTFDGAQVKGKGIGILSPFGGGAYIIALSTPEKFSRDLSAAAETIASNILYFQVDVSELARHFAGMWAHASSSTLVNLEFHSNGDFEYISEGGYSGSFSDQYGNQTGNWGVSSNDKTKGRWTVRGTKEEGVIIINYADGSENWIEYHVHQSKGQTYWREYYFDGKLYSKRR